MREYRKKWHEEYMCSDIKPSMGKNPKIYRKITGSWRKQGQKEIRREVQQLAPHIHADYHAELYYGLVHDTYPCEQCHRFTCDCGEKQ